MNLAEYNRKEVAIFNGMAAKFPTNSLKAYLGRLFSLRKVKEIFGTDESKHGLKKKFKRDAFPEYVFVLDESNVKVRVLKKDGVPVWIPKYFLHIEMNPPNNDGTLQTVQTLIDILLKYPFSEEEKEHLKTAIRLIKK